MQQTMDISTADIEPVTMTDILELATWNRPRTSDELRSFVETHHSALPDDTELE
jgi:hypothetical protein